MNRTATLTVAGAALVVAGVGLFAGPAFSADDPATSPRTAAATSSAQAPAEVPAEVPAVPTTAKHAAELTKQLAEAKVVPGTFQLTPALITSTAGGQAGPLEFYPIGQSSTEGYKATSVLVDGAGRATLSVFVQSAVKHPECTPANNCVVGKPVPHAGGATSSESTVRGADGTEVLVTRSTSADGKVTLLAGQARLSDGTLVTATVRAEIDEETAGSVATRDSVPLTEEQIVDLVVRPGFRH